MPLPRIGIPEASTPMAFPPWVPVAPPRKDTLLSTHESADDYRRTYKANVITFHVLNTYGKLPQEYPCGFDCEIKFVLESMCQTATGISMWHRLGTKLGTGIAMCPHRNIHVPVQVYLAVLPVINL